MANDNDHTDGGTNGDEGGFRSEEVFSRMLMLNPPDNQGVRFLMDKVAKKEHWREDMD
jgi:hypothetical protein